MNNQKGITVPILPVIITLLILGIAWIVNILKLADCDFEPNYKCEVIHGVGVVPLLSIVTVWFSPDND